jgi:amidase
MLLSLRHISNATLANVSGHPAVSLPAGLDGDGVPVGVQLLARRGREDVLLSVAAQLERTERWPLSPLARQSPGPGSGASGA